MITPRTTTSSQNANGSERRFLKERENEGKCGRGETVRKLGRPIKRGDGLEGGRRWKGPSPSRTAATDERGVCLLKANKGRRGSN